MPFIATGIPPSVVSARIDGRFIAVAEVAGEPVGGLQLEYLWGALPYIAMIRVLSHWQRRGVGRTLLGFVETALSAAGHSALLSSSQANEPEPQAWHLRMGFDRCGLLEGINEGGIDEVFFRKILAPAATAAAIATAQRNDR